MKNLPALGHSGQSPRLLPPRTYWLSTSLLAGVYPGSDPGGDARRKVRALCDAGVTLFIDLTDGDGKLEPYEHLLVSPACRSSLRVPDLTVTPVAVVRSALQMIDGESAAGGTTYVHCWGGIGRTGSIVGCWLADRTGGAAALDLLIELRSGCPDAARISPETAAQRRLVEGWPQRGVRMPDSLAGVSWEVLRWMGVESATCMLGDAGDFTGEVPLERADARLIGRLRAFVVPGRQLAVLNTGGDIDVPIEVAHQADEIVAVRLCLVDDVDVVDGTWVSLGRLTIGGRLSPPTRSVCRRTYTAKSSLSGPAPTSPRSSPLTTIFWR